jgi:hypothetical protein
VAGTATVSRSNPRTRLIVERIERLETIQLQASEVRVVPCASIAR